VPASKEKAAFNIGEWVVLTVVGTPWDAQVLDDLGRLGVNGERIYSVLVPQEAGAEPIVRDARESRLSPATSPNDLRSAQNA
jgi:hypothetical protein